MSKIAIISVLYDYPNSYQPIYTNKIVEDINTEDCYVLRYMSEHEGIKEESYYYKFTYFKIGKLVKFVEEKILNKYDYFILLDATDVAYVSKIQSIVEVMDEYKCNILFGSERFLWPNTEYSDLHDNKIINTPYKYLNAGVFCAKPESYILHVKNIINRGLVGLCDQGNWQIEYLLNDDIELDYKNKLVLNTYLAKEDIKLENNKVKFLTNEPIFIHDNGGYNDETIKLVDYYK